MTIPASRRRTVFAVEQTPKGVVERSCTTSDYMDEYVAEVELRGENVVLYVGSATLGLLATGGTISLSPANARHLAARLIALSEEADASVVAAPLAGTGQLPEKHAPHEGCGLIASDQAGSGDRAIDGQEPHQSEEGSQRSRQPTPESSPAPPSALTDRPSPPSITVDARKGAAFAGASHQTDPCGLTGHLIAPRPPEGGVA